MTSVRFVRKAAGFFFGGGIVLGKRAPSLPAIYGVWRAPGAFGAFLPCDAMQARSLQCLSVRPSVTFVDHVKTNKYIFEIFHHRVATPFKFFHTKGAADIPTGPP